jgi:hypothetical protein
VSDPDDIVALQVLADDVRRARKKTERLLRRLADLSRRVDDLNRGDPGAGGPTRMDGICRLSRIDSLRNDLMRVADMICEQLDQEPARYDRREIRFVDRLREAGVPLETLFSALEDAAEEPAP